LANSIKTNTQLAGKQKNKKNDPNPSQKNRTQSGPLRGIKTNHVPKPALIPKNILEKKDGEFKRTISLEKPSPKMIAHFKIKVT
jgi:hypothetical protein